LKKLYLITMLPITINSPRHWLQGHCCDDPSLANFADQSLLGFRYPDNYRDTDLQTISYFFPNFGARC